MRSRLSFYLVLIFAIALSSCRIELPEGVLPAEQMEQVIYDYTLARSMAETEFTYTESYKKELFIEYVYAKNEITAAQFDSSLVWYARNTQQLNKIYEKVKLRLEADKLSLDKKYQARYGYSDKQTLAGDRVNVWNKYPDQLLSNHLLTNKMLFKLAADSNFVVGDTFQWSMRCLFISEAKATNKVQLSLYLKLKNDSVINTFQAVDSTGWYHLSIVGDSMALKEVGGAVYVQRLDQKGARMVALQQISLIRKHAIKDSTSVKMDSVAHPTKKDTSRVIPPKQIALKKLDPDKKGSF